MTDIKELALSDEEIDAIWISSKGIIIGYREFAKIIAAKVEQAVHAKYAARDAEAVPLAYEYTADNDGVRYLGYRDPPELGVSNVLPLFTHAPAPVAVPDDIRALANECCEQYGTAHNNMTIYQLACFIRSLPQAPKEEA